MHLAEYHINKGNLKKARSILYNSRLQYYLKKNKELEYLLPFYSFLRGMIFYVEKDFVRAIKYYKYSYEIEKKIPLGKDGKTRLLNLLFLFKTYNRLQLYSLANNVAYHLFRQIQIHPKTKLYYYAGILLVSSPGFYKSRPAHFSVLQKLYLVKNYALYFHSDILLQGLEQFVRKILLGLLISRFDKKVFYALIPFIKTSKNKEIKALASALILIYLYPEHPKARKFLLIQSRKKTKIRSLWQYVSIKTEKLPPVLKQQIVKNTLNPIRSYFKEQKNNYEKLHSFIYQSIRSKHKALSDEKWAQTIRKLEKTKAELNDTLNFINNEIQSIKSFNPPLQPILQETPFYSVKYYFRFVNDIGNIFIETCRHKEKLYVLFGIVTGMGLAAPSVIPLIKSYFLSAFQKNSGPPVEGEKLLKYISSGIRNMGLVSIAVRTLLLQISKETIEIFGAGMYPLIYFTSQDFQVFTMKGAMLGTPVSIEKTLTQSSQLYSHKKIQLKPKEIIISSVCEIDNDFLPELHSLTRKNVSPNKLFNKIAKKFRKKVSSGQPPTAWEFGEDFGLLYIQRK